MLTDLNLRLRVFLFFCFLAVAGAGLAGLSLYFGWSRAEGELPSTAFVTAFVLFAFLNTAVVVAIWFLFDEHVAKPIITLSAKLRLQAHSGGEPVLPHSPARYLGDRAPAASAIAQTLGDSKVELDSLVEQETQRLRDERERLTALLTKIPMATILLNPDLEIVLYDGQAADVLSQVATPRLKAPLGDYFDAPDLDAAIEQLRDTSEVQFPLRNDAIGVSFEGRLSTLDNGCYMIVVNTPLGQLGPTDSRPLVFDFDLMNTAQTREVEATPLSELCFVPFDTETTGLSVDKDDIVQIGAVRVLNRRIVQGEVLDTYVDPGRPIPPASTRIHGVTDAHVTGAPDIGEAGRRLHHFARKAVLVAHNAPFDIGLLRAASNKMGVAWDHPVLDTVLLSAVVFGTTEEHSLDALCARLAIKIPDHLRHTALGDAKATAEALVCLLPLLEAKGITTFGELVEETRKHGRLLEDLNG
ncbi:MAG: PolC-type DNA polymerase III [Paracoccaceae bacterium]